MNIQGSPRPRLQLARLQRSKRHPRRTEPLAGIAHSVAARDPTRRWTCRRAALCSCLLNRGGLLNKQGARKQSIQVAHETTIKERVKCCVCQLSDPERPW